MKKLENLIKLLNENVLTYSIKKTGNLSEEEQKEARIFEKLSEESKSYIGQIPAANANPINDERLFELFINSLNSYVIALTTKGGFFSGSSISLLGSKIQLVIEKASRSEISINESIKKAIDESVSLNQQELLNTQNEKTRLEEGLKLEQQRLGQLSQEKLKLEENLKLEKSKLEALDQEKLRLTEELNNNKDMIEKLQLEKTSLSSQHAIVEKEIQEKKQALEKSQAEHERQKSSLQDFERKLTSKSEEIEAKRKELEVKSNEVITQLTELNLKEKQLKNLEEEINRRKIEIDNALKEKELLTKKLEEIKKINKELEKQNLEKEKTIREQKREINDLMTQLTQYTTHNKEKSIKGTQMSDASRMDEKKLTSEEKLKKITSSSRLKLIFELTSPKSSITNNLTQEQRLDLVFKVLLRYPSKDFSRLLGKNSNFGTLINNINNKTKNINENPDMSKDPDLNKLSDMIEDSIVLSNHWVKLSHTIQSGLDKKTTSTTKDSKQKTSSTLDIKSRYFDYCREILADGNGPFKHVEKGTRATYIDFFKKVKESRAEKNKIKNTPRLAGKK